jgi:hypothetical protein
MRFEHEKDGEKMVLETQDDTMTLDAVVHFYWFLLGCGYQSQSILDCFAEIIEEKKSIKNDDNN